MKPLLLGLRRAWHPMIGPITASVLFGLVVVSNGCGAQALTPYSAFQAMSQTQLDRLQGKLTYVGSQTASEYTVAFASSGHTVDLDPFAPYYRPRVFYVNDRSRVISFTATPQELEALIDSVGTLPAVSAGGVDSMGIVSFALLNVIGDSTKVFGLESTGV